MRCLGIPTEPKTEGTAGEQGTTTSVLLGYNTRRLQLLGALLSQATAELSAEAGIGSRVGDGGIYISVGCRRRLMLLHRQFEVADSPPERGFMSSKTGACLGSFSAALILLCALNTAMANDLACM